MIKMYSTRWCGDCVRAKHFLTRHRVAHEVVDIDSDREAAELVMVNNGGRRRVPTFAIEGRFYGNPGLDELGRILGLPE